RPPAEKAELPPRPPRRLDQAIDRRQRHRPWHWARRSVKPALVGIAVTACQVADLRQVEREGGGGRWRGDLVEARGHPSSGPLAEQLGHRPGVALGKLGEELRAHLVE